MEYSCSNHVLRVFQSVNSMWSAIGAFTFYHLHDIVKFPQTLIYYHVGNLVIVLGAFFNEHANTNSEILAHFIPG